MVTDLFPGLQRYLYLFSSFEIGINLMGHFSKFATPHSRFYVLPGDSFIITIAVR